MPDSAKLVFYISHEFLSAEYPIQPKYFIPYLTKVLLVYYS